MIKSWFSAYNLSNGFLSATKNVSDGCKRATRLSYLLGQGRRSAVSMAQAVVSVVVKKLGDLLIQEAAFLYGVRAQVEWIESELRGMQCFLLDADYKRRGHDEGVKNWVQDVRDVAYQAEDVIESFVLEVERRRRRRGLVGVVIRYVFIHYELIARHKAGREIGEIRTKILDIQDRRVRYGIANISGGGRSYADESVEARRRILPHDGDDADIVGFEDDRRAIVKQLLDKNNKRRCVISIVGMGGLGKTTLAKKVYNFSGIGRNFGVYTWVSVSQDYKVEGLLRMIMRKIIGIKDEELKTMEEEDLKEKLYGFLKEKKYFIVMDDIWSTDVWKRIEAAFPDTKNGSRILFTTRWIEVAKSADPAMPPYKLRFLNDTESWELFLRKVFPHQDIETSCPVELEELGQELAKRCGGLPLALVVLGGLLSKKEKDPIVWLKIKESLKWETTEDGKQCLEILALSYDDLPYDLKSCFLYLGCFPEDSEVTATKLIRLWTAEGFIPQRDKETLDETAGDFLEDLIQRCMVQVVERRSDGGVKKFRVHDLLRDLCIVEAREDRSLQVCSSQDQAASSLSRRVALFHYSPEMFESLNTSSPNLRTLLCFNVHASTNPVTLILHSLKLLRVVDLEGAPVYQLPKEISNMIHLRFLGLRSTKITELPSSIADLYYLQTLDVRQTQVKWLPSSFWKIRTLRHACFSWASVSPRRTDASKNLQTLKGVGGGPWIKKHLPKLTNLRNLGLLEVSSSDPKALCDSLEKLVHLASLRLSGITIPVEAMPASSRHQFLHVLHLNGQLSRESLPDSLEFPSNLTKLTLQKSALEQDPMATLEKLKNLRVLRLRSRAYKGKAMLCSAGGFPRLQYLQLHLMRELEDWMVEEGAMQGLTTLSIEDCENLKVLPRGLQHVSTLRELELVGMTAELLNRVREGNGEDWYSVRHVPSIVIR